MQKKPSILIILDGYGYNENKEFNAVYSAQPKNLNSWFKNYPYSILEASGRYVGLLDGMIGNSEVGHLTIGSGRTIRQPVRIFHDEIKNGSFFKNNLLIKRLNHLKEKNNTLHLMGLLSDAGVHSHEEDLFALIKLAHEIGLKDIVIHAFLDGRDVPPKSAAIYLSKLQNLLNDLKIGIIGSLHGRFYAMDRDNRWERIEKSYRVLTDQLAEDNLNWEEVLLQFYKDGITDEFVNPIQLNKRACMKHHDGLIFFNFRADRAREITRAIVEINFDKFQTKHLDLSWMISATEYFQEFKPDIQYNVLLEREIIKDTFFDVLEKAEKSIFTIAESEKYAHVTYFFNGGNETIRPLETRIVTPSKSFKNTYADMPQMSAPEITDAILAALKTNNHDFYLANYANADMVGHSGDFAATCKAIEIMDEELKKIYEEIVLKLDGTMYITADHGNAEDMFDTEFNQPSTAHSTNPVPFYYINKNLEGNNQKLELFELADIAPFILENLGLNIPNQMKKLK